MSGIGKVAEKALEDLMASNMAMDKLLRLAIEETKNALEEKIAQTNEPDVRLSAVRDALPMITALSKAVSRVKE